MNATTRTLAFKGKGSQTGLAATKEFPGIDFQGQNETFDDIAAMLSQECVVAALPMWNSHEGEIVKSRVLELLFGNRARLYRLWPKSIQFECIVKSRDPTHVKRVASIVSVSVAKTQCSRFIAETGASFVGVEATTVAYKRFCEDPAFDGALCAPGQNEDGYLLFRADAANPMNFTSFVLLACVDATNWSPQQWGPLHDLLVRRQGLYCAVQMPLASVSSEDEEALLSDLVADATTIDDIPKILFVAKRPPDRCGLLIESTRPVLSWDILTDEGFSKEIMVNLDLGETTALYTERVYTFLKDNFVGRINHDFMRHIGTQTCLFCCPPLRIITHGFDEHVVEPVVRRVIAKYFELIDNGLACSSSQREFFERHKEAYYEHGVDFMNFVDVGM